MKSSHVSKLDAMSNTTEKVAKVFSEQGTLNRAIATYISIPDLASFKRFASDTTKRAVLETLKHFFTRYLFASCE